MLVTVAFAGSAMARNITCEGILEFGSCGGYIASQNRPTCCINVNLEDAVLAVCKPGEHCKITGASTTCSKDPDPHRCQLITRLKSVRAWRAKPAPAAEGSDPTAAQKTPTDLLPPQFLGCYRTSSWGSEIWACRQPAPSEMNTGLSCPNGGILVRSNSWTTFEDWGCEIPAVTKQEDGIVVNEICRGEGEPEEMIEFWQLQNLADMTLLISKRRKKREIGNIGRCPDK